MNINVMGMLARGMKRGPPYAAAIIMEDNHLHNIRLYRPDRAVRADSPKHRESACSRFRVCFMQSIGIILHTLQGYTKITLRSCTGFMQDCKGQLVR